MARIARQPPRSVAVNVVRRHCFLSSHRHRQSTPSLCLQTAVNTAAAAVLQIAALPPPPLLKSRLAITFHQGFPADLPKIIAGSCHFGNFHRRICPNHIRLPPQYSQPSHRQLAFIIPSLVLARGHKIEEVPELPLVVSDFAKGVEKTNALKVLKQIGVFSDAEKAKDNHAIPPGKGKNAKPVC